MTPEPSELVVVGTVANEQEAAIVVGLLQEQGIAAVSDASTSMNVFGGLPFESGHQVAVPIESLAQARAILEQYPSFRPRD